MSKTFKGRVVLSGNISGKATVSQQAFNTSGSYFENMFAGRTDAAPCTDAANKELFGKDLSGAILCIPTTVGSTMGGMALMGMKSIGVGPQALLFSKPIDTLAAAVCSRARFATARACFAASARFRFRSASGIALAMRFAAAAAEAA